ncbi:MAG TPA: DUF1127 domain-containing protein [Acetobacteraceae bacterium]
MSVSSSFGFAAAQVRGRASFGTMVHKLGMHWQRARAQRQEIGRITRELQSYTDRQLTDLGMSRADIPDVARGTFRAG